MQVPPAVSAAAARQSATDADQALTSSAAPLGATQSSAAPPALDFLSTKDSLMNQLAPEPPSPYRPHAQKRVASVLPSYYQAKMQTSRLRDKAQRQLREAEAAAEAALQQTKAPIKTTLGKKRHSAAAAAASKGADAAADTLTPPKDTAAVDESIKEYHFWEAQRQQVCTEESAVRIECLSQEELLFTRILLQHFEALVHAITLSELTEEEQRRSQDVVANEDAAMRASKEARMAERRSLLEGIATRTATRLAEERFQRQLQRAFAALLPLHEEGRGAIMAAEQEDLLRLFAWEKDHRPLGPGCFIAGPVEDPRLRYARQTKRSRFHTKTTTELAIEALKGGRRPASGQNGERATSAGALVLYATLGTGEDAFPDPPNTTPEEFFVEGGRSRYAREKSARHEALRKAMAMEDLFTEEESRRAEVQLAESEHFMPLLVLGVDGIYAARRASRERERREAEEEKGAVALRIARLDAKSAVMAEDFAADPLAQEQAQQMGGKDCGVPIPTPAPGGSPRKGSQTGAFASPLETAMDPALGQLAGDAAPGNGVVPERSSRTNGEQGLELASVTANAGDLPSMTTTSISQSSLGLIVRSAFPARAGLLQALDEANKEEVAEGTVRAARAAVSEAKENAVRYLRDELWSSDLLMPEATVALLAAQDSITQEASKLLMDLASTRADIVNAQIEAILELCVPDEEEEQRHAG